MLGYLMPPGKPGHEGKADGSQTYKQIVKKKKGSVWNGPGCERLRSGSKSGLWGTKPLEESEAKIWIGPGTALPVLTKSLSQCLALSATCSKMPTHCGTSSGSHVSINSQFLLFISYCHNWNITSRQQRFGVCVC